MIKCAECGYENMDGLDYCDGCGAKLNAAAGTSTPAVAPPAVETPPPAAPAESAPVAAATASAPEAAMGEAKLESAADSASEIKAEAAPEPVKSDAPTGEIKPEAAPAAAPVSTPAAGGAPFKAKLSMVRGGRKGQEFPLEDGKNLIGRWDPDTGSFPEVDLDADDPEAKISRKHAMLIIENGKITIEDTGSLNGTYVNRGQRLAPGLPVDLKSGDEVIIGKTFLKLIVESIS
jgi:hypothetical protein